ncbi:histidine kinase N-terminal 7TM domain-containing diguanylate cyclase [Paenibacillus segetis]|nr:diguanylate cyclase [Paenibacillus segetis]
MAWVDIIVFFLLFALFVYVFVSVPITNLHKIYLAFHFSMMLWPFCQFVIKTTDNAQLQLFYVQLAFINMTLLALGWLLFTLFLTGHSKFLRRKISLLIYVPVILVTLSAIFNPKSMFVQPVHGGYVQRAYGPLFWVISAIFIGYLIVSLYFMYLALKSEQVSRIKKPVIQMRKGILVMSAFIFMDIFLNVVFPLPIPVIPGLTSLGILLSACFFVIAIRRYKVFDIVTIAHQDIIDTLILGILVLDDNETVVEINQSLSPYIQLEIGDRFDIGTFLLQEDPISEVDMFLEAYRERPQERNEIEVKYNNINFRHIKIHAAPIMVSHTMVGRILTFQDTSELHRLIDETNFQNEVLQLRNQSLIGIQHELFQTNQKLELMAITDSLTGCYNRHFLTQQLEHEVMKNMKYQIPFALFLLDIDFFKSVNDNYGHLAGDEVICNTVEIINKSLRQSDILARYGGEEFIIYLPNTNQDQAYHIAERVKQAVESNKVFVQNVEFPLSITVSMGFLAIHEFNKEISNNPKTILNEMFESVDKALYQAKNEGRNRIVSIVG